MLKAGIEKKLGAELTKIKTNVNSMFMRNKIDPFLKRMVTSAMDRGSRTTQCQCVKQWWSKTGEATQMVAKPGLTVSFGFDVSLVGDWKGIIYHELLPLNQWRCLQNGDYNRYIVVTIDISLHSIIEYVITHTHI